MLATVGQKRGHTRYFFVLSAQNEAHFGKNWAHPKHQSVKSRDQSSQVFCGKKKGDAPHQQTDVSQVLYKTLGMTERVGGGLILQRPSPCTRVLVYPCTCVPVYLCTRVPVYPCTCVPVYLCTCVPVYPCEDTVPFVPVEQISFEKRNERRSTKQTVESYISVTVSLVRCIHCFYISHHNTYSLYSYHIWFKSYHLTDSGPHHRPCVTPGVTAMCHLISCASI